MTLRGEQSGTATMTLVEENNSKSSNHKNICRKPPSLAFPNESTTSRTPIGTNRDSSDVELGRLPVCSPCRLNSLESFTTSSTTSAMSSIPTVGTSPLHFRSILPTDRERIQELHEEWFPVSYHSDFFDDLVLGKMCHTGDPLYTNLLVTDAGGDGGDPANDDIVACIVAAMMPTNKLNLTSRQLLISDPSRFTQLCYIMTLGTLHPYRKGGLATQLVEQCIADLVQSNPSCGTLYLHVITTNSSAIRFYERLGFWRVREIPDYYTIEGETHNCYLYAKYFHGNNGYIDWVRVVVAYLYKLWHTFRHSIVYLVALTSRQAMYYRRSFPSRSGSDPHNQNTHHKY